MRDITLGETFYHFFTTRAFATGVPTQLAGSPVLSVLEENNATPITAGVSVSVDRASVTGLNQATLVATSGNGFEAGKSYAIYISTGTVGGTSVVGEIVGEFTIQASAAFTRLGTPAGASLAADIAATKSDTVAIKAKTDNLPSDPADESLIIAATDAIMTRLGAPAVSVTADVAAIKADTAAVKVQTDKFGFTVTNQVDANIQYVNNIQVNGDGQPGTEWGP